MTISTSQFEWGSRRIQEEKLEGKVQIHLLDYREFSADKWGQYDKITCFEMSEHVGVRNYQTYMAQVKALLKPDGIFFLQIAGLRRYWAYEDLIWGNFMGKYIFPGADASCPMYWNASQLERGGFEIMSVRNQGVHYAHTIEAWYHNIVKNREVVEKKYGVFAYRLHEVFLAWSTMIARQGSSTVWLIIATHNHAVDNYSVPARGGAILNRSKQFINKKRYIT
jgi:cyclopropane fatty-acyl-phospholipid synthase-like methyltransferase